jgi:hypothetical protein
MPKHPAQAYNTGLWAIDSNLPDSEPVEVQVSTLLDQLAQGAGGIRKLAANGLIGEFYCSYFMEKTTGSVDLSAAVMRRVGDLPAKLLVAVYYVGSVDSTT